MQTIAWGLTLFLTLPAQTDSGSGSARVAVVNIPEVSDKYQRTADLEAQFDAIRGKYNQDRDAMKDRLDRMTKSLREELKPGTDEFRERAKQITMLEAEFKWFSEAEGQKIEEGLKSTLRSIFDDIQGAVKEVADEKGIDVVLVCDRLPDQPPETPSQLRQQIVLQKVIYWNPRVEITSDVIARLNTRYQARGGNQTGAAVPAPAAAADAAKNKPKEKAEAKRPGGGFMTISFPLAQLAEIVGGVLRGGGNPTVTGVADVAEAGPGDITWVTNPKYVEKLPDSRAAAVLVASDYGPTPMPAILCPRIDRSVAKLLAAFAPPVPQFGPGIHPTAVVHPSARIAPAAYVGPQCVVEEGAAIGARSVLRAGVFIGQESTLGENCVLWPGVTVRDRCKVGNRVLIHPNAVIGADGLGFYFDEGRHQKVPHIGGVIIGDDVEIGACTCIDRAKFADTIIGRGTKIDNLVQIAHNVRIGDHCVIAGCTGIGGSSRAGDYCVIGGRASVVDHVTLGRGVRMAMMAAATKDIPDGQTVSGFPAWEHRKEMQVQASLRRLPEMVAQLRELMARVERLEASVHHQP